MSDTPINASEQQSIAKSLLVIINENYNYLPVSKIEYQSLDTSRSSMSLYSFNTSYIKQKYVSGSFIANYKFSIVYRSVPTNTNQRINREEILNNLGDWIISLNLSDYVSLTNNRTFSDIIIESPASLYKQYKNGTEDYHIIFNLTYKKEE